MKRNVRQSHILLLIVMVLSLVGGFFKPLMSDNLFLVLWQPLLILGPVFFMLRVNRRPLGPALRFHSLKGKDVLLLIAVTLTFQPMIAAIVEVANRLFGNQLDFVFAGFGNLNPVVLFLSLVLAPTFCEEILFRGAIMDGYRFKSVKTMIIMNGVLFGLMHGNINQFLYTFVMGVFIAYAVYKTHSLWAGILMHFVNNGLSALAQVYPNNPMVQAEQWMYATSTGGELARFAVFVAVSILASLWILTRLERTPSAQVAYDKWTTLGLEPLDLDQVDTDAVEGRPVSKVSATQGVIGESNGQISGGVNREKSREAKVQEPPMSPKDEPVFDWALTVVGVLFVLTSTLIWFAASLYEAGLIEM